MMTPPKKKKERSLSTAKHKSFGKRLKNYVLQIETINFKKSVPLSTNVLYKCINHMVHKIGHLAGCDTDKTIFDFTIESDGLTFTGDLLSAEPKLQI